MRFTYEYTPRNGMWTIYLDGVEIDSRLTEDEAAIYCSIENQHAAAEGIGG